MPAYDAFDSRSPTPREKANQIRPQRQRPRTPKTLGQDTAKLLNVQDETADVSRSFQRQQGKPDDDRFRPTPVQLPTVARLPRETCRLNHDLEELASAVAHPPQKTVFKRDQAFMRRRGTTRAVRRTMDEGCRSPPEAQRLSEKPAAGNQPKESQPIGNQAQKALQRAARGSVVASSGPPEKPKQKVAKAFFGDRPRVVRSISSSSSLGLTQEGSVHDSRPGSAARSFSPRRLMHKTGRGRGRGQARARSTGRARYEAKSGPGTGRAVTAAQEEIVPKVMLPETKRLCDLSRLSLSLRIPMHVLKMALDIFEKSCEYPKGKNDNFVSSFNFADTANRDPTEFDGIKDGVLTQESFGKVLKRITSTGCQTDILADVLYNAFDEADKNHSGNVDFAEFAMWYSRHGFSEDVFLTAEQRDIRGIARKYNLPLTEVEKYKATFDTFDEDGSGKIEYEEFERVVGALLKVPKDMELPLRRVKLFWSEVDKEQNGAINFEEFLVFYIRYFKQTPISPDMCPFRKFYRSLRPVCVFHCTH